MKDLILFIAISVLCMVILAGVLEQQRSIVDLHTEVNRLDTTLEDFVYIQESLKMQNITYEKVALTGFFRTSGYYCVLTDGRDPRQWSNTEDHEICHALVDLNYYHFCEEYYD